MQVDKQKDSIFHHAKGGTGREKAQGAELGEYRARTSEAEGEPIYRRGYPGSCSALGEDAHRSPWILAQEKLHFPSDVIACLCPDARAEHPGLLQLWSWIVRRRKAGESGPRLGGE